MSAILPAVPSLSSVVSTTPVPTVKEENHVRRAVDSAGGPTCVATQLEVSNACVHKWINAKRVPKIDKAKKLARLSGTDLLKLRPPKEY